VQPKQLILIAGLALAAHAAGAQTVWRCGNSYSEQPCAGGTPVAATDARSPAQATRSSRVAQADMKLADKMEKERLAREKNAPKALVIGPQQAAPEQKAAKKAGKPDQFTAMSPRAPGAKKPVKKKKAKA
jgi:hypothetical protein